MRRGSSRLLAGLLAFALLLAPQGAAAQALPIGRAAVCQDARDLGRCLLRVLADHNVGADLLFDSELSARPALLAEAGVSRQRLEAWLAGLGAPHRERHLRLKYQAELAAEDAARLDASGQPPEVALAPVLALPHDPRPLYLSARRWALYQLATRGDEHIYGWDARPAISAPLLRIALAAWEPLVGPAAIPPGDRVEIARLWLGLGEIETARRVLYARTPEIPEAQAELAGMWSSLRKPRPAPRFMDRDLALHNARDGARKVEEGLAKGPLQPQARFFLADDALGAAASAARAGDMAFARTMLRTAVELAGDEVTTPPRSHGQLTPVYLLQIAKGDLRAAGLL